MVVFTCNNCGESVQKPKVDKHYMMCRKPKSLSCMDCFKDFNDDYLSHTKCITEMERYSAKGYQPKPNSVKGEIKQEKWLETIKSFLHKPINIPQAQVAIIATIAKHDNVPRKKNKFVNFIKNVCYRANPKDVDDIYEMLDAEHKIKSTSNDDNKNNSIVSTSNSNGNYNGFISKIQNNNDIPNQFKWKPTILSIVKKRSKISRRKLFKKVLKEFVKFQSDLVVPNNILNIYNSKLNKIKQIKENNDKVFLLS